MFACPLSMVPEHYECHVSEITCLLPENPLVWRSLRYKLTAKFCCHDGMCLCQRFRFSMRVPHQVVFRRTVTKFPSAQLSADLKKNPVNCGNPNPVLSPLNWVMKKHRTEKWLISPCFISICMCWLAQVLACFGVSVNICWYHTNT